MFIPLIPLIALYFSWKFYSDRASVKAAFGIVPPLRYISVDLLFAVGFVIFEFSLFGIILWLLTYYDQTMIYDLLVKYEDPSNVSGITGSGIGASLFFILLGAIIAPLFEEAFFRGGVLRFLAGKTSAVLALILSSLVFGLFHGWDRMATASIAGIFLGIIYFKYKGILGSYLCHGFHNLLLLSLIAIGGNSGSNTMDPGQAFTHFDGVYYRFLIGFLISLPAVIFFFKKNWRYVREAGAEKLQTEAAVKAD